MCPAGSGSHPSLPSQGHRSSAGYIVGHWLGPTSVAGKPPARTGHPSPNFPNFFARGEFSLSRRVKSARLPASEGVRAADCEGGGSDEVGGR